MLLRQKAIWKPKDYHYSLPSGEHTDVFIRVADAIQEPHDAYVTACWLSDQVENGCGVIVDTGGLTPLLIQLESLLNRFDLEIGPTAILPAYPTGRPTVRRTVEASRSSVSRRTVGLLSVSSTGNLLRTLTDELERIEESDGIGFTLDVVVDRTSGTETRQLGNTSRHTSWLNIESGSHADDPASCQLCYRAEKAPVVAVDPRSYGELELPRPYLVMPDTKYADAGHLFWERASQCRGRAIEVNPRPESKAARGKRLSLPVSPIFELIAQGDDLMEDVRERWQGVLSDRPVADGFAESVERTALVVAASQDVDKARIPSFAGNGEVDLLRSLRHVLGGLGLNRELPVVSAEDQSALQNHVSELGDYDTVLIFSWGAVTGLTLRHLKLIVADAIRQHASDLHVNALVFHARPSSPSEWESWQNQFRPNTLECLWSSCFPWESPLQEERRLIDSLEVFTTKLSNNGLEFLRSRRQFLNMRETYARETDDWSPRFQFSAQGAHPEHIFWGMSHDKIHQEHVRGRSLYGKELDCLTAYAAMGSVIHYTRMKVEARAAPRWVMFNMGRIVRSYFDAVITCSLLRWLRPGELSWNERNDPSSIRDSVTFLLDQVENSEEQVLLVPELLLASAQGKVPGHVHDLVCERASTIRDRWPDTEPFNHARGAVEIGLRLLEMN